jgi:deoxyribodipyrimidine photo-lyase
MSNPVPKNRIRNLNENAIDGDGKFVLYWMTAFRRTRYNFALQRAIELAVELKKPLVILDAVRLRYPWASDRLHRFLIDGMLDHQKALEKKPVTYFPYLEPAPGQGGGLVKEFCRSASVVVADDFPCFFHPVLYNRIAKRYPAKIELVDSNGVMPMAVQERTFTVAHSYRRYMQKTIPDFLNEFPREDPFANIQLPSLQSLPKTISQTWKPTDLSSFTDRSQGLDQFDIDHSVVMTDEVGGQSAARQQLRHFLSDQLATYGHDRNVPDDRGSSQLSPYFHFGNISAHEVFASLMEKANWTESELGKPNGKRNGYWNADEDTEAYLDQLLTWREMGFNMCHREENFDTFESLPDWAQTTLNEHEADPREHVYSLEEFETAQTHDDLWNAAQRQLVREGRIHNYMRMLWGKKILHWTANARDALAILIELNNKYALDGRDPNSYSGIFWTLGRYDRAWGPERPIFGKVRYMTSDSTRKKWPVKKYLAEFSK